VIVYRLMVQATHGADQIRRLRAWLKIGLRAFGLRCVEIQETRQQGRTTMDMRKFSGSVIRPEDLYDGPRVEKIIAIFEHEKHNCVVFELESGCQFYCWGNHARILSRAWGFESDNWKGQEFELSLGHYTDKRDDPPTEKETIAIRAISPAKPEAGNGGVPALRDALNDEIPF
jgi:hypothetical protein